MIRYEYVLDLSDYKRPNPSETAASLQFRPAQPTSLQALAELMIEAYRGTIDYDGETVEDAVAEVKAYFTGQRGGPPLLEASCLAFEGGSMAGACLAAEWQERQYPTIAYIMTHAAWKNQGLARQMLEKVLDALHRQGHRKVGAVITGGNVASERLFARFGFEKVGPIE